MNTKLIKIIFIISVLILLNEKNQLLFAQDKQLNKFIGSWLSEDLVEASMTKVSFKARNNPMRYSITIEENNGQLRAVLDSPDRNIKLNSDEITISGDSIGIKFKEIDAIYRGNLNSDKDQLYGSLIFVGRMFTLGLRKTSDLE
ncbi:MAG: hypothetical protein KF721_09795 [Ignavibacteriaceae bacterium]|nr:hypothetical protein [Ignavibacteriaceae bacterium]